MKLFEQIERLSLMHKLIREAKTGTPNCFAQRLQISPRWLFTLLDELKDLGAPIAYSRTLETYYYKKEFELNLTCSFRILEQVEQDATYAGTNFIPSSTAFFMQ